MIDSFVLLAPVLLLIVVALLRFVGCTFTPGEASVSPPTFNPPAGTYTGAQAVTISDDAGDSIYFTTDGSPPLAPDSPGGPSPLYDGTPINVAVNTTIGAIAAETGFSDSAPAFAAYVINIAPPAPIVFQPPVSEKDETTNSITVATPAFTRNVTAGNLMVVWLWYRSTAQTIASVTDSAGNNYQRAVGPTVGAGALATFQQEVWFKANLTGGANVVVTATFSSAPGAAFERAISAHEYSGASTTAPVDATSATVGATANASTGPVAITTARQIFGAAILSGAGTAGTGFTQRSALKGNATEDGPVTTPGSATATFTNTAQDWIAQMIALK
jgi:Chitobiase/beta-hexosaminidase C-terminal domain